MSLNSVVGGTLTAKNKSKKCKCVLLCRASSSLSSFFHQKSFCEKKWFLHISGFTPTDINKAFTDRKINVIEVKEHLLFGLKIKVVAQHI